MYLLFLLRCHYKTDTVMVAIFVFDTNIMEQRSRMIKHGKSCKEKGREQCKVLNNKDGFQNK